MIRHIGHSLYISWRTPLRNSLARQWLTMPRGLPHNPAATLGEYRRGLIAGEPPPFRRVVFFHVAVLRAVLRYVLYVVSPPSRKTKSRETKPFLFYFSHVYPIPPLNTTLRSLPAMLDFAAVESPSGVKFVGRIKDIVGGSTSPLPQCYSSPAADPSKGSWRACEHGMDESPTDMVNWSYSQREFGRSPG